MSAPRDRASSRFEYSHAAPHPCRMGCKAFRPEACEVLDPFTVEMRVRCIHCGKPQKRIGDLRGLIDDERTAETFARDFMKAPVYGPEAA